MNDTSSGNDSKSPEPTLQEKVLSKATRTHQMEEILAMLQELGLNTGHVIKFLKILKKYKVSQNALEMLLRHGILEDGISKSLTKVEAGD